MKIHIITIFPESFWSYMSSSIVWNAKIIGLFEVFIYKLNDFSEDRFRRVDDKAYWTHGQVIKPEPLSKAIEHIFLKTWKKIPVIYMSPSWDLLNQEKLEKFSKTLNEFIIICGHYEWIDQRIIDYYVNYEISIWEYVLTSWELASMVFIDSLVRFIPKVLWNSQSLVEDSFSLKFNWKKEYPHYTRPRNFLWISVPEVLLNWNHSEIENWKKGNLKD